MTETTQQHSRTEEAGFPFYSLRNEGLAAALSTSIVSKHRGKGNRKLANTKVMRKINITTIDETISLRSTPASGTSEATVHLNVS